MAGDWWFSATRLYQKKVGGGSAYVGGVRHVNLFLVWLEGIAEYGSGNDVLLIRKVVAGG